MMRRRARLLTAAALIAGTVVVPASGTMAAPGGQAGPAEERVERLQALLPDVALERSRVLEDGRTQRIYTLDQETADLGRMRASDVSRAGENRRDDVNAKVDFHLDLAMRAGRNVDIAAVDVIAVEVPDTAAVHFVQDRADELAVAEMVVTENGDDSFMFGIHYGAANDEAATAGTSAGFDAATGSNVWNKGRGGRTLFWTPAYNSSVDHWVTTNWEKWQSKSNYRDWGYNRYATFDAADGGSAGGGMRWRGDLVDATIRSRPWKGYESRVVGGPYDYDPRPSSSCQTYTASLNVGSYASLSIPVMNCTSEYEVYPNANAHSMGTAWYGRTTGQRYLDFAFEFRTSSNSTIPVFADYVWMEVQYCKSYTGAQCGLWNPSQYLKWTDSGW